MKFVAQLCHSLSKDTPFESCPLKDVSLCHPERVREERDPLQQRGLQQQCPTHGAGRLAVL